MPHPARRMTCTGPVPPRRRARVHVRVSASAVTTPAAEQPTESALEAQPATRTVRPHPPSQSAPKPDTSPRWRPRLSPSNDCRNALLRPSAPRTVGVATSITGACFTLHTTKPTRSTSRTSSPASATPTARREMISAVGGRFTPTPVGRATPDGGPALLRSRQDIGKGGQYPLSRPLGRYGRLEVLTAVAGEVLPADVHLLRGPLHAGRLQLAGQALGVPVPVVGIQVLQAL